MSELSAVEKLEISEYVPVFNLGKLREKIEDLNKRARKLKLPPVTLAYGPKKIKTIKIYDMSMDVTMVKCIIAGEYPRLPGYKFVAKLEKMGDRNLILGAGEQIDESWVTINSYCDHCKSKRDRKETFLIRKEETGEIKQIGSNCIDQFIGRNSLSAIAMRATLFSIFDDEGLFNSDDEEMKMPKVVYTEDFIASAIACTRSFGFRSMAQAEGTAGKLGTAVLAFDRLIPVLDEKFRADFPVNESDFELAAFALQNIDTILADFGNQSLAANIKTICSSPDIHYNHINIAALLGKLALEKRGIDVSIRKEQETPVSESNFLGAVGEKIIARVTVEKKINFESRFNSSGTNMIIMKDGSGNVILTMTSGSFNPSIDSVIEIKGTIKTHKQYKDVKQTVLQRVSITHCLQIETLKQSLANNEFSMKYFPNYKTEEKNSPWDGDIRADLQGLAKKANMTSDSCDIYNVLGDIDNPPEGKCGQFTLWVKSESSHDENIYFDLFAKRKDNYIEYFAQLSLNQKSKKKQL